MGFGESFCKAAVPDTGFTVSKIETACFFRISKDRMNILDAEIILPTVILKHAAALQSKDVASDG